MLRVMSYNVRCDALTHEPHSWRRRRDAVAGIIRARQVDLAALQEPFLAQVRDLAVRLPEYSWLGAGRDDGRKRGELNPSFYQHARYTVRSHDTFWLSPTPDVPGSRGWDAAWPRIVTWARLFDRKAGRELALFNTHLDHEGAPSGIGDRPRF